MELAKRIEYAKEVGHDFIAKKGDCYMSGAWDDQAYAIKNGWEILGTVADLYRKEAKKQ